MAALTSTPTLVFHPPVIQEPDVCESTAEDDDDDDGLPPVESSPSLTVSLPHRARPYLHSHHRSRSSATSPSPSAPAMARAHSSPVVGTTGRVMFSDSGGNDNNNYYYYSSSSSSSSSSGRTASPSTLYRRYHSPSRRLMDDTGVGETVWEETESAGSIECGSHERTERRHGTLTPLPTYHSHTFPRRHRPSSPLQYQMLTSNTFTPTRSSSRAASPVSNVVLAKYNEAYPSPPTQLTMSTSSASSMPSTPTSARSRSPSVSSLETIPDSPDAEEAAMEAERIIPLKPAADRVDGADGGEGDDGDSIPSVMVRRRSYFDVSRASGRAAGAGAGPGHARFPYGSHDKRKRWSVCGAERRSDLDLETIWED